MSNQDSEFHDIDLGTDDRDHSVDQFALPNAGSGSPAVFENGQPSETAAEIVHNERDTFDEEHDASELTHHGQSANAGEEAAHTSMLPTDPETAFKAPSANPSTLEPTNNEPTSATPLWDKLQNMDFGPLNEEEPDMNFEAATTNAAEKARGYDYEKRPKSPFHKSHIDDLALYTSWVHQGHRPGDFEYRAVAAHANGQTSPLRNVKSADDLALGSPEEEWEAFVSNTDPAGEKSETSENAELWGELFGEGVTEEPGPVNDAIKEAAFKDGAAGEPVSHPQEAAANASKLHISTSDVEIRRPIAIRPSSSEAPAQAEQPDDNNDEPNTPPSAEALEMMTGIPAEEALDLLEETYEELKGQNFSNAAETLVFKRRLLYAEKERRKYNGFNDRYLEQIENGEHGEVAAEMFKKVSGHFYREQREELKLAVEEEYEKRLDAVNRIKEDEYEIGMLKHKVDEQEGDLKKIRNDLARKTREAKLLEEAYASVEHLAKAEYDRRERLGLAEGEEETRDKGTQMDPPLQDSGTRESEWLPRDAQPASKLDVLTLQVADLKQRNNDLEELNKVNREQYCELQNRLDKDDRAWEAIPDDVESARDYVDDLQKQHWALKDENRKVTEENARLLKLLNDYRRWHEEQKEGGASPPEEEGGQEKEAAGQSLAAVSSELLNQSTPPAARPQSISDGTPPSSSPPLPSSSSDDLSQYFMQIDPCSPPPPSIIPKPQAWLDLEAEMRKTDVYKQARAAFLRNYKVAYERRIAEDARRQQSAVVGAA